MKPPDGSERDYLDLKSPLADANSGGISVSKKSQPNIIEVLLKPNHRPLSDREFRDLIDSVPIRIAVVDCGQRYRFSNLAHRQSWVGQSGEIIGKTMCDVLGVENYESARPYVEKALAGEETSFDMTVRYSPSEISFVRINYLPQFGVSGEVTGCLVLALDVTEKKLSEEALRQSEARFGRLVEHTPVIPWEMDLDSQLFTFVGHRCEEILGYPLSEWRRPRFRDKYLHLEDKQAVSSVIEKILADQSEVELEYRLLHKDQTYIWVRDLISPIIKDHKVVALQGLMIDVTLSKEAELERSRLDARLREFQKMQALGNLAGGIAHDFNNILGGIIGYTELALSCQNNQKQSQKYLERIRDSSYRARDLVKQILSFSKGRVIEKKPTKLYSLLHEVLQLIRASIPSSIEVVFDQQVKDLVVSINPTQLHQVILNICTNAAYAMREKGGQLHIQLSKCGSKEIIDRQVPDLKIDNYAVVKISDTGHGMSPDVMSRIFEPYYTTKPTGEGSGLGLAVAHGIINNHGGTIMVESVLGKGTTFEIFLPYCLEAGCEQEDKVQIFSLPCGVAHEKKEIVLVDDEEMLVDIGSNMLGHLGYEVVGFTSSTKALEYIKNNSASIDLLITDQTMPEMTGDALIRQVYKVKGGLPVILCTGYSAMIDRAGANKLGVNFFLSKPYSIIELCNAVKSILDS